jgi:hypothetical protein
MFNGGNAMKKMTRRERSRSVRQATKYTGPIG